MTLHKRKKGHDRSKICNNLKMAINFQVRNELIRSILNSQFTDLFENRCYQSRKNFEMQSIIWLVFLGVVNNYKPRNLTWETFCRDYNLDFYTRLKKLIFPHPFAFLDDHRSDMTSNYEKKKKSDGWKMYLSTVIGFYKTAAMCDVNCKGATEFKRFIGAINNYSTTVQFMSDEWADFRRKCISNYPMESKLDDMITVTLNGTMANYNVRNGNGLIKNLMIGYISKLDHSHFSLIQVRVFVFYFVESLGDKSVYKLEDFTEDLCFTQHHFFYALNEELLNGPFRWKKRHIYENLVHFYRYVDGLYYKKKKENLFRKEFDIALYKGSCSQIIEFGERPIFYSRHDQPPTNDRFCVVPNKNTMRNARSSNNKNYKISLDDVDETYRGIVKEYIWYGKGSFHNKVGTIPMVKFMLKYKNQYDNDRNNVIYMTEQEGDFSNYFLFELRCFIESQSDRDPRYILDSVRRFLNFYKRRTGERIKMDILNVKGMSKYLGGNPIDKNDLRVIYKGFVDKESESEYGRLYTIIFEIFLSTKIRYGEIVNLKRGCISDGSIGMQSKLSFGDEKWMMVSDRVVKLIAEAIEISGKTMKNPQKDDLIFVRPRKNWEGKITYRRIDFYTYFKGILKKAEEELSDRKFAPNNLRHTFVDNAYKEGKKLNYSIERIAGITGNSYSVAAKNYREYGELVGYLEAFSGHVFVDVDYLGNILETDTTESNQEVNNNLGKCTSDGCTFKIGKCLRCRQFVTFPSRAGRFKTEIERLNEEILTIENENERFEMILDIKYLTRYLYDFMKKEWFYG